MTYQDVTPTPQVAHLRVVLALTTQQYQARGGGLHLHAR